MLEESSSHSQAFQRAYDTTIECRTLIQYHFQYHSDLSDAQKEELLSKIEAMLAFLSNPQETNAGIGTSSPFSPEKLADLLIYNGMGDEMLFPDHPPLTPRTEHEISLHQLHKLYHAYLSDEPGKGLALMEARYKTVMVGIDQLQALAELRRDATASDLTIDSLINRVSGFVSESYSIFREFGALFAKALEGQSIDIDTEAMQQLVYDITPLKRVYDRQHEFQQRRGPLHESANDATALLIFLQKNLEQTFARRQEIVTQIKSTSTLLDELITLLADYEQAVENIMQSLSKSH